MATAAPVVHLDGVTATETSTDGLAPQGLSDGRSKSYMAATEEVAAPGLEASPTLPVAAPVAAPVARPAQTIVRSDSKSKQNDAKNDALAAIEMDEHQLSSEEVAARYNTSMENGLSKKAAEELLAINGKNAMTPGYQKPEWIKLCEQLFYGFAALLWIGSILCFIAYAVEMDDNDNDFSKTPKDNFFLGTVLALVVIITGIFSYFQEKKSSDTMKKFAKLVPKTCCVIRDGTMDQSFNPENLVVGDIIFVKNGDKVPADIRIFQSDQMKVDNSSLTGESEAQKRNTTPQPNEPRSMEANNLAFFTCNVVNGSAKGIVVRTGDLTIIGQIQALVSGTDKKKTPIAKEIDHFIHLITAVAVALGFTFFFITVGLEWDFMDSVIVLIAIIVANVPEGLLATVTVTLTIAALQMAKNNVLIKNLESVETLGSTSCICSDKTGTLTQNKMTVVHVMFNNQISRCEATMDTKITGDDEHDSVDMTDTSWKKLWTCAQLANVTVFDYAHEDAVPKQKGNQQERLAVGDASETAILKCCDRLADMEAGGDTFYKEAEEFRAAHPKKLNIPFNSSDKFAASVHDQGAGKPLLFCLKGAPERVLAKCGSVMLDGQVVALTPALRKTIAAKQDALSNQGERVLAFAMEELDSNTYTSDTKWEDEKPFNGLTADDRQSQVFVGLMALIDPPRTAVPAAVKDCQSGGIQVIMVTGDHPGTAKAIAKSIGIIRGDIGEDLAIKEGVVGEGKKYADFKDMPEAEQWDYFDKADAQVVAGGDLENWTEAQLDRVIKNHGEVVFARTSPAQKKRIVEACQRAGKIVAVTGDGVNDSPALKAADIGVAMGIAGSEVTKEAADMILLNDDFASIVKGVEQGRIVFDNLKKSIAYTLTSNIPEISPFLFSIIAACPLPLSTIMILAIDVGTDMYPAISMAYEGAESDIMNRHPRDPKTDNLVGLKLLQYTYCQIGIIQACAGFFCFFVVMSDCGFKPQSLLGLYDSEQIWTKEEYHSITDSYNQEWTLESREIAQQAGQTSYFTSIVIVQWADLIICKTRVLSLFQQGMRNKVMNKALVFETCLAIFLSYCPGMDSFFKTRPLQFVWWLPALTFSVFIFIYDEIRKYIIRQDRIKLDFVKTGAVGWVERTTYY
jgi:sodium/potassium-transporting ATPase subunit alpha